MTAEQLVKQAMQAAGGDDRVTARRLLAEALRLDPQCAQAWYVLAQVVTDREQAVYCLKKVLELQPGNRLALELLQKLGAAKVVLPPDPLDRPRLPRRRSWWKIALLAAVVIGVLAAVAPWWGWGSCGKILAGQAMGKLRPAI